MTFGLCATAMCGAFLWAMLLFSTGCAVSAKAEPDARTEAEAQIDQFDHAANVRMIQDLRERQREGAVVRERALFPYHFEDDSSRLNELGRQDVERVARASDGGTCVLHLRRGVATDDLYRARTQAVLAALADSGVEGSRVSFDELPVAGDGVMSDRVRLILTREKQGPPGSGPGGSAGTPTGPGGAGTSTAPTGIKS